MPATRLYDYESYIQQRNLFKGIKPVAAAKFCLNRN